MRTALKKALPYVIATGVILILPFFKALPLDARPMKGKMEQTDSTKTAISPKPTYKERAKMAKQALYSDVMAHVLAEPALYTLPKEDIYKLVSAILSYRPENRRTEVVRPVSISKLVYGPDKQVEPGSDGRPKARTLVELQNALIRLAGFLMYEWRIDILSSVATEPTNSRNFEVLVIFYSASPSTDELIRMAEEKGLLKNKRN
ncbi:MAG: hypothetical protein V1728_02280 [Candidatus Micrarchaeota archaeon]